LMSENNEVKKAIDLERVADLTRQLLIEIGEDSNREGLQGTPDRVARWWKEFIEYEPGNMETTFESVTANQMIVVSGMRIWSLCEHHLLPFWADITIGYIPNGKVLGLSKFARIAHKFAHRPQIQERLVEQIANEVISITGSQDVAVLASGVHLCMLMRGIRTPGIMTSSAIRGGFMSNPAVRQEFFNLSQQKAPSNLW